MENEKEIVNRKLNFLPNKPGCYLMKNEAGTIIYVGKAKILMNRVKQYFTRPQVGKVARMVKEVRDFDIIETDNEKEALLLEIHLIQKYYPKYNIMLKDGKMYPFIAIRKDSNPYLRIVRDNKNPKSFIYFGPYPNSGAAYKMLHLLNSLFPLRKCITLPPRPCLYYYMGQCLGPCIKTVGKKQTDTIIRNIEKFLRGDNSAVKDDLTKKMLAASEEQNFELANTYKKLIQSIEHININQKIVMKDHIDRDIVGYSTREGYISILFLLYRKGVLLGKNLFVLEEEDSIDDQLSSTIVQFYQIHPKPKELIIANKGICDVLSEALDIKVIVPLRGQKKDQLYLALENAKKGLDDHFLTARLEDDNLRLLNELKTKLNMENPPLDIELYDNSHLQGENAIGAMVKFVNGVRSPKHYRKYNIRGENKKDDLAMMEEVLKRRFNRLSQELQNFPDLIIVDGGENQVNVAKKVLEEFPSCHTHIAGLYKNDKHETEGLIDGKDNSIVYIANRSPLFFLLMRMQDEVHRYAISTHRNKRNKSLFEDIFQTIPGIGKKRSAMLLNAYPTFSALSSATKMELMQILPEELADKLLEIIKEKQKQGFGIQ